MKAQLECKYICIFLPLANHVTNKCVQYRHCKDEITSSEGLSGERRGEEGELRQKEALVKPHHVGPGAAAGEKFTPL